MKQVEVYKEALRLLEKARVFTSRRGYVYWTFETFDFWALCPLIRYIASEDSKVPSRFKQDSEVVIGKELDEDRFWFTNMNEDEPKARSERIEHLESLIKLYEDEKTICTANI